MKSTETRNNNPNQIKGWTPKTSFLLRNPGGGYDIIDHAFHPPRFPSDVLEELQSSGWMDRLHKSRTNVEVNMADLIQFSLGSELRNSHEKKGIRGDESVFLSREVRDNESFRRHHPALVRLIDSIETTARDSLCDEEFELNYDKTSVQLARYRGDGNSGYPRHCDSGPSCQSESNATTTTTTYNRKDSNGRLLTFVYYLTPKDWDPELDGGALRIFPSSGDDDGAWCDIFPFSNRMVVFRSDRVEHQVLPSFRRDRIALTVWLYGKSKTKSKQVTGALQIDTSGVPVSCNVSSLPPPLPLPESNVQSTADEETIFVAIPSYRDPETWPTIQSLLQSARHPERIRIGVVWQVDTSSPEEVRLLTEGGDYLKSVIEAYDGKRFRWDIQSNFRSLTMDYKQARGPCYARHLAQTLHRGEEYILQIDSHMRFRPGYDVYLIHQLNKFDDRSDALQAVLTSYPPNYDPPDGPGPDAETRATLLVPWKFDEDGMLRQKGRLIRSDYTHKNTTANNDNIPCLLYAGGFNFSHSKLLDVCPYDHKLHDIFFGEELSMAVRLYTHGYSIFSPLETVCYHQWKRNPLRTKAPSEPNECERKASQEVVRMQLQGHGKDLGTQRSAKQFSEELGVDFDGLTLADGCENGVLPVDAFVDPISLFASNQHSRLKPEDMDNVLRLVSDF